MNRRLQRSALGLTATAALLTGNSAAFASPPLPDEPVTEQPAAPAAQAPGGPSIQLDDGRVIGPNDEVTFTFLGERPKNGGIHPQSCPEVNDRPVITVKGTPRFIEDKSKPQSTWLLPRQKVSWQVSGEHSFTADVVVGAESEVGAIIAKAKAKIDVKIGNTWTWKGSQTVEDTNNTTTGYRAVLGSVGWRLTSVKTWIAPPCKTKTLKTVVDTPRDGDMSIGRINK